EGEITKDKMIKIFELMDLLHLHKENKITKQNFDSISSKIWNIIYKYFFTTDFTSTMVLEKFEDEYNQSIKLSIISTYLFRFVNKGKIIRSKSGREWNYKIKTLSTMNS
ncbi:MAG: hypothetical protein KAF24_02485, partial [Nitrosopumilaceae archaeon]|nr:hypothetical protein [Nitrosopumilaceae archaeon]